MPPIGTLLPPDQSETAPCILKIRIIIKGLFKILPCRSILFSAERKYHRREGLNSFEAEVTEETWKNPRAPSLRLVGIFAGGAPAKGLPERSV